MKGDAKHVFLVAEIAQSHDGSLGIAHSYIDALADTGIDAVKFQTHIAEAESSPYETFRVPFSYEDTTRYGYWKRMEFTLGQWMGLKEHCDQVGLEMISSPFSSAAVDLLEEVNVKKYKIGSGEVTNLLLLEKIARTGKEIILSSGLSSMEELRSSIDFIKSFGNKVSVLQCTTAYPTRPAEWGLNVMEVFKKTFDIPVGFSDHSGDIFACMAAATMGAEILEFHVVFDRMMFGPDSKASLTIGEVKKLADGVKKIREALNQPIVKGEGETTKLKTLFGKSIAINCSMKKGDVITFDVLESKKPAGRGIPPALYQSILGKRLKRDLEAFSFLNEEDLQ